MHREALLYLYYGSEWAIRIAMLLVVPQKRSPAAARTWLLFIFLLPWPGLVLYALVGRPYVSRRRVDLLGHVSTLIRTSQEMWRKATGRSRPGLAPAFEPAMRLAEKLGDFNTSAGTRWSSSPITNNPSTASWPTSTPQRTTHTSSITSSPTTRRGCG